MATRTNIGATGAEAKALAGRLTGAKIGSFALEVTDTRPIRQRAGWLYVRLAIRCKRGLSVDPLMTGIVSAGGRGVRPWIECRLFPTVTLDATKTIDARRSGLEAGVVNVVSRLIPPGGHLMIDYENPGQEETFAELSLRVPPPATHLGSLMFRAGCRGEFKDWYFSEGGHEGPRKLQANKSPDAAAARRAMQDHGRELAAFVAQALPADKSQAKVIAKAQARARELLKTMAHRSVGR